jgi:hypothetical protein
MSQPQGGQPDEPAAPGAGAEAGHPAGYPPPYAPYAQAHHPAGYPGYQAHGGYPGRAGYPSYPPKRPSAISRLRPETAASIAVFVCALVCYFAGFATGGAHFYVAIYVLLAGGLLCAVHAIRSGKATAEGSASPNTIVTGAVLSVLGGLGVLFEVIHLSALPVSAVIILIFALLQLVVAVAAFLLESGLLALPPPRRAGPPPWSPAMPPNGGSQPTTQWGGPPRSAPAGDAADAQVTRPGMAWPQSETAHAPGTNERPDPEQHRGAADPDSGKDQSARKGTGPGPTAYLPTTPENAPHGYGTTPGSHPGP